jgi:predicted DNA-binding protein
MAYLDSVAKNNKVPKAVYLRRLIEKDMESSS